MSKVKLIEKKKPNKSFQRTVELDQGDAETYLKKSRGWELDEKSKFIFKDGSLVPKASEESPKKNK